MTSLLGLTLSDWRSALNCFLSACFPKKQEERPPSHFLLRLLPHQSRTGRRRRREAETNLSARWLTSAHLNTRRPPAKVLQRCRSKAARRPLLQHHDDASRLRPQLAHQVLQLPAHLDQSENRVHLLGGVAKKRLAVLKASSSYQLMT